MREINVIKNICENQKTISTKKLHGFISIIGKRLKEYSEKINAQKNTIKELNKKYRQELNKAKSRERAMADFENLKRKHSHLKQKHTELSEAYNNLKSRDKE